jgi:uncharacterized protein YutE (UPF0331/DUF86 family)
MPIDVNQLKQRITEVLDAKAELKRLTSKPYVELGKEARYAVRYQTIVLAEALGGVCLHIAKEDLDREPASFSKCFRLMDKEGVCNDCARDLVRIVGLRNLLIHRYWTIDDRRVYDSVKNDFRGVDRFVEGVKKRYAIDV